MPLRKKLSLRGGSPSSATPGSDKDGERASSSGRTGDGSHPRKSSLLSLRSLSLSLPSKENRRLSLPSPIKRKSSNESQGSSCSPSCDSSLLQITEDGDSRKDSRKDLGVSNSNSKKPDGMSSEPTTKCVPVRIQLQNCSDHLDNSSSPLNSPTFKIEDYSSRNHGAAQKKSMPISIAQSRRKKIDIVAISELTQSPKHYGLRRSQHVEEETDESQHSPSLNGGTNVSLMTLRNGSNESLIFNHPSSPLLMAVKKAVDSLNQYEDFEIIEEIGSGYFADVFKVRHTPTGQLMVLKRNKKKSRVGLLKEVELLKRLHHPNILHYVGACIHEGQLHPLTEYISGGTLEDLIQSDNSFPWSLRIRLSLDIAKGMEYLNENNMLHRDLNSHNVLLRSFGMKYTAVVADFGLAAKTVPAVKKLTRAQSIVGTPYWMAPEVLNGKPYDETADVFSYGIVLCEVISRLSADPDYIPRTKDYGLDREKFRSLPQVTEDCCPIEFMELAFAACRLVPSDRPLFGGIKTQLYDIREIHNFQILSQDSLDCADDDIQPQPPIRLSIHRDRSVSPSYLLDSPSPSNSEFEYSSQPQCSSPIFNTTVPSQLKAAKSLETVV